MAHIPEQHKLKYRKLKTIADDFEHAGDMLGSGYSEDANKAYALASKYRQMATEIRTNPCTYTFAHTKHWCGNQACRDS